MPDELCAIPPPFLNARYGNLQTLPRPTAKPTQVRMNSTGFDHSALCNMTSHQLTIVSVDSYAPVVLPPIPHFIWSPLNIITFFLVSLSKSTFDFCTDCLAQIQSVGKTGMVCKCWTTVTARHLILISIFMGKIRDIEGLLLLTKNL